MHPITIEKLNLVLQGQPNVKSVLRYKVGKSNITKSRKDLK
jgi:hypothetical protein